MNTHLRALIAELKELGWTYQLQQTNGSNHFVHPEFGKIVVASTPADWEDECQYTRQRARKAMRRQHPIPVEPTANNSPQDPLKQAFSHIQTLEEELKLSQEGFQKFWAVFMTSAQQWGEQHIAARKKLIEVMLNKLATVRLKTRDREKLEGLTAGLYESTLNVFGFDLAKENPALERFYAMFIKMADEHEDNPQNPSEFDFASMSDEELDQWFDDDHTSWKPDAAKNKPPRKEKPQKTSPHAVNPEALTRNIYLNLARQLHPDKSTNAHEHEERTRWMQHLNDAYQKKDMRTLLSLLKSHGQATDSFTGHEQDALVQALKLQEKNLRQEVREAWSQLPNIGEDWKKILTNEKSKERFLRKEYQKSVQSLRIIDHVREILIEDGPQALLKKYSLMDLYIALS